MAVLVLDSSLPELQSLLESRRRSGIDRFDEVWDGVLHLSPHHDSAHALLGARLAVLFDQPARAAGLRPAAGGFNLGAPDNYRVPDGGLLRPSEQGLWVSTAALVIEIVSPNDESWQKLPFYASHGVDEVLIIDPEQRQVDWLALRGADAGAYADAERYQWVERSSVIKFGPGALAQLLDWPAAGS